MSPNIILGLLPIKNISIYPLEELSYIFILKFNLLGNIWYVLMLLEVYTVKLFFSDSRSGGNSLVVSDTLRQSQLLTFQLQPPSKGMHSSILTPTEELNIMSLGNRIGKPRAFVMACISVVPLSPIVLKFGNSLSEHSLTALISTV